MALGAVRPTAYSRADTEGYRFLRKAHDVAWISAWRAAPLDLCVGCPSLPEQDVFSRIDMLNQHVLPGTHGMLLRRTRGSHFTDIDAVEMVTRP